MGSVELSISIYHSYRFFKDFEPSYGKIEVLVWSGIEKCEGKTLRSKFNLKFSNLLHMSKGRICIGNYMDNVSMMLGYKHAIFYYG